MYRILTLLTLYTLLLFTVKVNGQDQANNWFFGYHCGLDFSNGAPIFNSSGQVNTVEAASSISDSSGNLLFYTNGLKVYNNNHNIIQNGSNILGSASLSQILFIPKPESDSLFYLFYSEQGGGNLRYSIINKNLNNGNGGIAATDKNIYLLSNTSEKMACVNACNGKDVWFVVHNYASHTLKTFLITQNGICPPKNFLIGSDLPTCCETMKFSPDGKWLALTNNNSGGIYTPHPTRVYSFDNRNGNYSLKATIQPDVSSNETHYGISFSPNSSKLYISTSYYLTPQGTYSYIYQYDMNAPNFINSKEIVFSEHQNQGNIEYPLGSIQNSPDGKIYVARWNDSALLVINYPDSLGLNCDIVLDTSILNNHTSGLGLPNFNESYFNVNPPDTNNCICNSCYSADQISRSDCDTLVSFSGNQIWTQSGFYFDTIHSLFGCDSIFIVNATLLKPDTTFDTIVTCKNYFWNETNTYYTIPGTYSATYTAANGCDSIHSIVLNFGNINPNIYQSNDSLITDFIATEYQWLNCDSTYYPIPNETNYFYIPQTTGSYSLSVNLDGCRDTTQCYNFISTSIINENSEQQHLIYPNPASTVVYFNKVESKSYIFDVTGKLVTSIRKGQTALNIEFLEPGIYFFKTNFNNKSYTIQFIKQMK